MGLEQLFHEYFSGLDRAGNKDRCYLCCRTPAEVKHFFGFAEDGTPLNAAQFGIEDVVLDRFDVMSYRGVRPVCAVCQLNFDGISLLGEQGVVHELQGEMEHSRERLWPAQNTGP